MAQIHSALKTAAALLAAMLLAACSLLSSQRPTPPAPEPSQAQPLPPGQSSPLPSSHPPAVIRENHLSSATNSLVTQAHTQIAHGDLPAASSTLDRAVRIEPYNPLLWIEMGRLRLAENDAHQAEGCGRKALALASGDRAAQSQAGRLLADALRAQRRNQEARDVEEQPFMR
jgi:predicted Zn-dependent protease